MHQRLKLSLILLLVATVAWIKPVAAQNNSPDAATIDAARQLMEVSGASKVAVQLLDQILPQMADLMTKLNPERGALAATVMEELFAPEMRRRMPEFMDEAAVVYARYFTLEELQGIAAFYDTPLGQKVIATMPELNTELFGIGSAWGRRVVVEVFEQIAPLLRERGLNTPDI